MDLAAEVVQEGDRRLRQEWHPLSQMQLDNFRHILITNWIERAEDIYTVIQLCGTSVRMIEKQYGRPDFDRLHERYLIFMSGRAAG